MFMDYIRAVDTNDRMALVVYNGPDGNAMVETPLTTDLPLVADAGSPAAGGSLPQLHEYRCRHGSSSTGTGTERPLRGLQDDRADDRR